MGAFVGNRLKVFLYSSGPIYTCQPECMPVKYIYVYTVLLSHITDIESKTYWIVSFLANIKSKTILSSWLPLFLSKLPNGPRSLFINHSLLTSFVSNWVIKVIQRKSGLSPEIFCSSNVQLLWNCMYVTFAIFTLATQHLHLRRTVELEMKIYGWNIRISLQYSI